MSELAPRELSGWGRHPVVSGVERVSEDLEAATRGASLSRGLGRSYGDASLPAHPGAVGALTAGRIIHTAGRFVERVTDVVKKALAS